jgi:hypothetical protein
MMLHEVLNYDVNSELLLVRVTFLLARVADPSRRDLARHTARASRAILAAVLTVAAGSSLAQQPGAPGGSVGASHGVRTELARAVEGAARGSWVELRTQIPGGYQSFFRSSTGSDWHFNYADSGRWYSATQCAYFYGGGHMALPVFVRYCARDNQWSMLPLPPWLDLKGSVWGYAVHGYDKNALDNRQGLLYYFRSPRDGEVFRYDIGRNEWGRLRGGYGPGTWLIAEAGEYFPGLGPIALHAADGAIYRFDERSRRWDKLANVPLASKNHNFAEYSSVHRVMLLGGGDESREVWLLDERGQVRRAAQAPLPIRTSNGQDGGLVTADPASGDFVYLHASGRMYSYDPRADQWRKGKQTPLGPVDFTIGIPVRDHGVIMYARADTGRVWLYKHAK